MTDEKRLIDANSLKVLFDERYDDAFMQSHTRPNIAYWEGYSCGVNWGRNTIVDVPTIDAVEMVHGRWIICSDGYYPHCSVCNEEPKHGEMTSFCPNCGAKMDLE